MGSWQPWGSLHACCQKIRPRSPAYHVKSRRNLLPFASKAFHDSVSVAATVPFNLPPDATLALFVMRRRSAVYLLSLAWSLGLLGCSDPARPGNRKGKPISTALLCDCKPAHITKDDWRIERKNGPLPHLEPEDTTVAA